MDVAIGLPNAVPKTTGAELTEWARRAEARGLSSLGTIDRIAYGNYEPLTALAGAAAVTERIGLATTVLLGPLRPNATELAKRALSLHALSTGASPSGSGSAGVRTITPRAASRCLPRKRRWIACSTESPMPGPAIAIGPSSPAGRDCWSAAASMPPSRAPRRTPTADRWRPGPGRTAAAAEKVKIRVVQGGREGSRDGRFGYSRSATRVSGTPGSTSSTTTWGSGTRPVMIAARPHPRGGRPGDMAYDGPAPTNSSSFPPPVMGVGRPRDASLASELERSAIKLEGGLRRNYVKVLMGNSGRGTLGNRGVAGRR